MSMDSGIAIATLIPAYKEQYIDDLLLSISRQTVRPTLVIISDDSPDDRYSDRIRSINHTLLKEIRLEVIRGPKNGPVPNIHNLIDHWDRRTELVHFLLDDDVIYPDFYERHLQIHRLNAHSLSVSKRWTALESGMPVGQLTIPSIVRNNPSKFIEIDSATLIRSVVPNATNWLGELSSAVLNNEAINTLKASRLNDISYYGLEDIGLFIDCSTRKPICWINESLGFFRMNPGQNTRQTRSKTCIASCLAWISLAISAKNLSAITTREYQQSLSTSIARINLLYEGDAKMGSIIKCLAKMINGSVAAEQEFLEFWNDLISKPGLEDCSIDEYISFSTPPSEI